MIKYHDKILPDYDIDQQTGIITSSLTGQIQSLKLHHGWLEFKGMPCHVIQICTHIGWRPGFDVHHRDHNKLNNSLANLEYISRAEHVRHHRIGKEANALTKTKISKIRQGGHWWHIGDQKKYSVDRPGPEWQPGVGEFSAEHRANISKAKAGKQMQQSHKNKISTAMLNMKWWHKGDVEIRSKQTPGQDWTPGRLSGQKWWNNGKVTKRSFTCPGPGWFLGRLSNSNQCSGNPTQT